MKILAVDVGTGTQDILLYDSRLDIENSFKLVLPSPTMILHRRIKQATREHKAILLTGVIMGGGPSAWAAEAHVKAGLQVYAMPDAARSFNDDLNAVRQSGIEVISEDEARRLPGDVLRLEMRDFDLAAIEAAFDKFGVKINDLDALAVAVFDHGNAPVDISDRKFRFDYLDDRIRKENRLSAFAYRSEEIPAIMTRLQAVAASAGDVDAPLVVMDTAPAAVLGSLYDRTVTGMERKLVANVGNFHTLAFRLGPGGIEGVFEHHTGLLDPTRLETLLLQLADSSLTREEVFDTNGHGALVYDAQPMELDGRLVVTGPRRSMLAASALRPYFAVPFGDMMVAGCFGLLSAAADILPELAGPVHASLQGEGGSGVSPWDI